MRRFHLYQIEYPGPDRKREEILVEDHLDLEDFVRENELNGEEEQRLNNLRVGEEMHFGGGACVHSFVRRVL